MRQFTLNEEHLELINECKRLRKILKPDYKEKTEFEMMISSLNFYKTFMEMDLKDRQGYIV